MRLDLFLKHARLLKRRSAAQAAIGDGLVLLNGRATKPGRSVKAGDILTLLEEGEESPRRIRILQEALRAVPKGREGEFFREEPPA
jgi:ribosomal 50S subunit-recycling heat shock protein